MRLDKTNINDDTLAVHAGVTQDPRTGASSTPIYQCSTYHQEDPLNLAEYDYSRSGNPTRAALEQAVAELEGGAMGLAFGSGMAAICSTILIFRPGDHLVVCEDVYGGTFRVMHGLFQRWGLQVTFADATSIEEIKAAVQDNTVGIYVESPSNPLLKITDLKAVADLCKEKKIYAITDNTFMSPYLQKPIELGFDIVIHSATKFLGGHSDVVAGTVVTKTEKVGLLVRHAQNAFGAILGPQDSWLIHRGIKTLQVRMKQQQETAQQMAEWLNEHPAVKHVLYPGLPSHPGHEVHMSQSLGGGAVLSFEVETQEEAVKLMNGVTIPLVSVSLGGVESILSYPTTMSHAAMPAKERAERGITDGLMRLSCGVESFEDLQKDFEKALG